MPALGDGGDPAVGCRLVDVVSIERAAIPLTQMRVLFVVGVVHGIDEQFEARKAADILGWAASLARDEARVLLVRIARSGILDGNAMAPVVAHVIGVGQRADAATDEHAEPQVLRGSEIAFGPWGSGTP